MAITIIDRKSVNLNNGGRRQQTRFLVTHHTAGGTLQSNIDTLRKDGNSYHYLIDTDGKIYQVVDDDNIAFHALPVNNNVSIGISLVAPNDNGITPEQVTAAEELGRNLIRKYDLPSNAVYGHGEISGNKEPTEGLTVAREIRDNKAPPRYDLTSLQNTQPNTSSNETNADEYFKKTYIDILNNIRPPFTIVTSAIQQNKLVVTLPSIRRSASQIPLQDFVSNTALVSNSQLAGELALLRGISEVAVEFTQDIRNVTSRTSGFIPTEAAYLVAAGLFEFFPELMRQKMSANSQVDITGEAPNYSHAWRAPGKLAITANVTIPGASGFRIGQIFQVGRTYEHYKQFGAFQLFGLTETIDLSRGWTTELYARFNAMPKSKLAGLQTV
jgi:hypothetical protein